MHAYSLFVDYLPVDGGERRQVRPILVEALNQQEATRIAAGVADFAFPEICMDIVIRLMGSDESGPIAGEVRRPD